MCLKKEGQEVDYQPGWGGKVEGGGGDTNIGCGGELATESRATKRPH